MSAAGPLAPLLAALKPVPGIAAIVLGGSRGRGRANPSSDYDVGLYFEPTAPLVVPALRAALAPIVENPAETVTDVGTWGPWIIGGGWLRVEGCDVDLLNRDIAGVRRALADARAGLFTMHYQVGHPHGFCSTIWVGEAATCQVLHDPAGAVAALKADADPYPEALAAALIGAFGWELDFAVDNAMTALGRGERTHIAGCAYRAMACAAQVLFALNRQWLINEKGALAEAAQFAIAPADLAAREAQIWAAIGEGALAKAVGLLRELAADVTALMR